LSTLSLAQLSLAAEVTLARTSAVVNNNQNLKKLRQKIKKRKVAKEAASG